MLNAPMLFSVLFSSNPAQAADHHFGAQLMTDVPIKVGAGLSYQSPQRIRVDLSTGVVPAPYVDVINWTLVTAGVYSDLTAELIDVLLQNSLILHGEVGWQPWADRGWYGSLGYQFIALAGDTAEAELFTEGIGAELLENVREFDIQVRPHMLTLRVGHEWILKERIVLRANVGFAYTIASNSTVVVTEETDRSGARASTNTVEFAAEEYLDFIFTQYVHFPLVGVSAGYRF